MSRVLLVGKGAPDRGGIATFLETLCTSDLMHRHDVEFLNVAHEGNPEGGRATAGNIRRTVADAVSVWRSASDRDIVHIHTALAPAVTLLRMATLALAARTRGCSVIVHAHGGGVLHWMTTARRRLLVRLAMSPVHRVVAVWSAGEQALLQVLAAERVRLVDNGVSLESFPHIDREDHDPPRVLFVGLLTPRKGVIDLLEASAILRERGAPHELWLLGGTPDEGVAAEAEVRKRLDGCVTLLGTRPPERMPEAYAAADVFCLPSWWEAMPLSVLEAMATGLPVVATDVGDVSRLVLDGETGLVVPPRSPVELADALATLLASPDARRRMGAAGRARAERYFSSSTTVSAVSDLYAELEGDRR